MYEIWQIQYLSSHAEFLLTTCISLHAVPKKRARWIFLKRMIAWQTQRRKSVFLHARSGSISYLCKQDMKRSLPLNEFCGSEIQYTRCGTQCVLRKYKPLVVRRFYSSQCTTKSHTSLLSSHTEPHSAKDQASRWNMMFLKRTAFK